MVIYCFVEGGGDGYKLDNFISNHENDVVHLYSSVIESCEGNLFYCLGEIINNCLQSDGELWFVTDVKELYDVVNDIYRFFFEKIIYIEQNNEKTFSCGFDFTDLIEYFLQLNRGRAYYSNMRRLYEYKEDDKVTSVYKNFTDMIELHIEKNEKDKAIMNTFCLMLLYDVHDEDSGKYLLYKLALYSVLMELSNDSSYANKYMELILADSRISADNMYFVWNQYKRKSLLNSISFDESLRNMQNELYDRAYDFYKEKLSLELNKIPRDERNKNLVLICTIQLLGSNHAPTKTVIERAQALRRIGKEVVIVNTCEQYLYSGYLPTYKAVYGNVFEEYDDLSSIKFGDDEFWFFQLRQDFSGIDRARVLKYIISNLKPYYILSIGTGSMAADLCGNIIPCASMALAFSTFAHTKNKIRIIGRNLSDEERALYKEEDIVESRFTFKLGKQKKTFTRKELNIPEDRFVLVVVGIRLTYEIDEAFLKMLSEVCDKGCYAVFAGYFDNYDKYTEKDAVLKENSAYIGFCDDVRALMEICDLYVNPNRIGGGFSVIEAFDKGKPGVYLKRGDVYTAGGEEFAVGSYDEMISAILRYKDDSQYYSEMAQKAIERVALMTSSETAIRDIDNQICSLIEEKYW